MGVLWNLGKKFEKSPYDLLGNSCGNHLGKEGEKGLKSASAFSYSTREKVTRILKSISESAGQAEIKTEWGAVEESNYSRKGGCFGEGKRQKIPPLTTDTRLSQKVKRHLGGKRCCIKGEQEKRSRMWLMKAQTRPLSDFLKPGLAV